MTMDQLHKSIYFALTTDSVTSLLSSSITSVAAPALLVDEGGTDRLFIDTGGTDVLLIEAFEPIFAYVSPQMFESENAALFPFITYSVPADQISRTKDKVGANAIVQVDIWHRTPAMTDLYPISDAVVAALDNVTLEPFDGFICCQCVSREFDTDPDGKTKRAMLEFRVTSLA